MVTVVEVDVALHRPPRVHETRTVVVSTEGESLTDAQLLAIQMVMVHADVVMPVGSRVVDVLEV